MHYALMTFATEADEPGVPRPAATRQSLPVRLAEVGGSVVVDMTFHPSFVSTTLRGDVLTDGPFLDAEEVVAGITVVEAADLDQALRMARLVPVVSGGVEVRPLLDLRAGGPS